MPPSSIDIPGLMYQPIDRLHISEGPMCSFFRDKGRGRIAG